MNPDYESSSGVFRNLKKGTLGSTFNQPINQSIIIAGTEPIEQ